MRANKLPNPNVVALPDQNLLLNYQSPPGSTGKKPTYKKGPTKIPTPGGYIVLHTS